MRYTSKYVKYIKTLDLGSSPKEFYFFSSSLRTTGLMTRLKHRFSSDRIDENCERAFDLLYLNLGSLKSRDSRCLVIIYIPSGDFSAIRGRMNLVDRHVTFTELKKQGALSWRLKCYDEDFSKIELSNGESLKLWKRPYLLHAVTNYDKDFRKEWVDGFLEYEGNEYGDTSTFYIIGCVGET